MAKKPPAPKRFMLRCPPNLHKYMVKEAEREGRSLNSQIIMILRKHAETRRK